MEYLSTGQKYETRTVVAVLGVVVAVLGIAVAVGAWVLPNPFGNEAVSTATVTVSVPGPTVTATETITSVETTTTAEARSTSPKTSPSTTSNFPIRLNDVPPITERYPWETQTVQVRGETIRNALVADAFYPTTGWSDARHIPLNGKYSRLTGSVAIADGGEVGTEVTIDIEVDGEIEVPGTLTIGQTPIVFDLNLTGANDLKLLVTKTEARGYGASVAFIDAWLTPA